MPIYEYTCQACEHRFEELVSSSGGTIVACPHCASGKVEKLFSSFAFRAVGGDMPQPRAGGGGGGCCGGSCGCGH